MRAITIEPGKAGSVRLEQVQEPALDDGRLLVSMVAVGVCGTDREILAGRYGTAPHGSTRLVIGHESLGVVMDAPSDSGFVAGDPVVGIVRRPDPVPCVNCAVGEWDMCRNGRYTEHGIKEADGFCSERFRIDPAFAVRVDPALGISAVLLEPASIVAKAWEHAESIGQRARWVPRRALVTGAGPVGLLAALLGKQRGLEVHVLDRHETGPKPALVRDLGAAYHVGALQDLGFQADVLLECTGAPAVIAQALSRTAHGGIVCLTGLSSGQHEVAIDAALLNRTLVLENDVVFGSVNANRRHYEAAALALADAERAWLDRLITRRVPLDRWHEAFERREHDVKTVIDFTALGRSG